MSLLFGLDSVLIEDTRAELERDVAIVWDETSTVEEPNHLDSVLIEDTIVWGETSTVEEPNQLDSVLIEDTKAELERDVAIVWGETRTVEEPNRLDSVLIEDMKAELDRFFSPAELLKHGISFGGPEQFKKIRQITEQSILAGFSEFARTAGLAKTPRKKHISVKYKTITYHMEISSFLSLDALIKAVENKFKLAIPVKHLYRLDDSYTVVVTDITDLRDGFLYYVATANEEKKEEDMVELDGFYKKLKSDEDMGDEEIEITMAVFSEQKITYKQLMKTGELKMTDEKLKEYGITKGGLRKAILSVIANLNKN